MNHFRVFAFVLASLAGGCAASNEEEDVAAGGESALTQQAAFNGLVGGGEQTFRSGGATDCGHVLTLTKGSTVNTGSYVYSFHDCDAGDRLRSQGTFKVVSGWLGGLVTDPTLENTPASNPNRPDDDTTPWSYKVRTQKSEDGMLPKGTIFIESTSTGAAKLYPEGTNS